MMFPLNRLILLLVVSSWASGAAPTAVAAQDSSKRLSDSTRWRLLGCGTHETTLRRRQATIEVKQALSKVSGCPEGAAVIARLWGELSTSDSAFSKALAGVSSIAQRPVALAMLHTLDDRNRPTSIRLTVLGRFLAQLTTEYGSSISFGTSRIARVDSTGRILGYDPLREAYLSRVDPHRDSPAAIEPTLREQVIASINRIAGDPREPEDLRVAAREVSAVLSRKSR